MLTIQIVTVKYKQQSVSESYFVLTIFILNIFHYKHDVEHQCETFYTTVIQLHIYIY